MADQPLFDPGPVQRPDRDYDPNEWSKAPDIAWHASKSETPPKPSGVKTHSFTGFHAGTLQAATQRAWDVDVGENERRPHIHPYALSGQFALPPTGSLSAREAIANKTWLNGKPEYAHAPNVWSDSAQDSTRAISSAESGQNIPYVNEAEHKGSVSFMTTRPENLSTWSESTLSDPNAPTHLRALAEHYELVGKRTESRPYPSIVQESLPGIGARHVQQQTNWSAHPQGTIGEHPSDTSYEEFGPVVNTLRRKY